MKLFVLMATLFSSQLVLGAEYDSSTYALLTNELNRAIHERDWHCCRTNELGVVERVGFCMPINKAFSDEVINSLCVICPKEWQEASASSGNMHNPKMLPLRPYFNKAVFFTPTVQRFEAFVKERIDKEAYIEIYHEKLGYVKNSGTRIGTRKINCILGVGIYRLKRPVRSKSEEEGQSKGRKSTVADRVVSDLPPTIVLIRITGNRYEKRKMLNGQTDFVPVKDGVVECTLKDELYYGVKKGSAVQVISPIRNIKDNQHTVLTGNKEAGGSGFKDPIYTFADINYYGRNVIAMRNDGTLLLGSLITAGELIPEELTCDVGIGETDIIDAFRRRSVNSLSTMRR